jgi:DNA polymerase-3 subunit alpha
MLRVEIGDVERLTKLIPSGPAFSVTSPRRATRCRGEAAAAQDEPNSKVLDLGSRIEGLARHASVHAAGVVIAPGPLTDYVPVCTAPDSKGDQDAIITQYDMAGIEHVGMLKIDLLGLKTLTVLHDATVMVAERHGVTIDLERPDLNDPKVYALLRSGRTAGIFQFESPLATDCLRNMKCDRFDDLVATNALLRPGPLDTGCISFYQPCWPREVRYLASCARKILMPTYGDRLTGKRSKKGWERASGYSLADRRCAKRARRSELIQEELGLPKRARSRAGMMLCTVEEIAAQIETFNATVSKSRTRLA